MRMKTRILAAHGGFFTETYKAFGIRGCLRKVAAAIKMQLPMLALGRRTNSSVAAYFDLITDDARMFYGDSFHFGYFIRGDESFEEALDNHTDIVAEMAQTDSAGEVLDIGCGICAPAIRIAGRHNCRITGVNISAEQVRQGRELVAREGLAKQISVVEGNALNLPFARESYDAALCLEVAGDICVTDAQKHRLAAEVHRVLRPGGRIGFSDLVFTSRPSRKEECAMRAILYHNGAELITDWPTIFRSRGFRVDRCEDIIGQTMKTWEHSLAVYESRAADVARRFGSSIARRIVRHLEMIPDILRTHGSFVVFSAEKI